MISIYTVSIHPIFMEEYFKFGVGRVAKDLGINIYHINLRDFAVDSHASVDSCPYSQEDGMVLRPEPLRDALIYIQNGSDLKPYVVYTATYGKLWNHSHAKTFAKSVSEGNWKYLNQQFDTTRSDKLVFICGRFSGIDQRFIDKYVDDLYSLGDYVVSGGELPVLMMIDSILRYIPGVLGNDQSSIKESFEDSLDGKIEYPLYSRPQEFEGLRVPDVLLSGNHKKIKEWKEMMSSQITQKFRPDLLKK